MQILTDFPGANIRLLSREGNTFHLTPDLRVWNLCSGFSRKRFCECGEIGIRDRFRFYWISVQVQALSLAPYRVFITNLTGLAWTLDCFFA